VGGDEGAAIEQGVVVGTYRQRQRRPAAPVVGRGGKIRPAEEEHGK